MKLIKKLFIKFFASVAISVGLFIIIFVATMFLFGHQTAESLFHPLFFIVAILVAFPFVYKYMKVK
jgi:hypothetical protein